MTRPENLKENVPLAPLTTLKIGGPARFFLSAVTEHEVIDAFEFADEKNLQVFVLGGGSNILVSDNGFHGLVVQTALRGISVKPNGEHIALTAKAGEDWDHFVERCVRENLAGVECLSGIPGYVGGTPVQNVGAYGQEVSQTIVSVRCLDRDNGNIVEIDNEECGFTYRKSIFNNIAHDRFVVLSVTYRLLRDGEPTIMYKDLVEHFGGRTATLPAVRETVLKIRRAKSMVIDENDPNARSVGSFFKNPIVSAAKYAEIQANLPENVPRFPAGTDTFKIPAAWLIENSGFHKGYRLGRACISTRHTLALVNCGNASAADILNLKQRIQDGVEARFSIMLQPEPVFVGF